MYRDDKDCKNNGSGWVDYKYKILKKQVEFILCASARRSGALLRIHGHTIDRAAGEIRSLLI